MNKDSDDSTNCPVCFEQYEETGDHLPRLLPCTHTLCHTCTVQLMKNGKLTCPEDREIHSCKKGIRAFPQNKYILNLLRRKVNKVGFQVCQKHEREKNLYCTRKKCCTEICSLCMMESHSQHRHCVEDLLRLKEMKLTEIQSEVDKFSKILAECRKTLMDAKHRTNDEFISNLQLIKSNNENCNSKILVKLEKVEEIFSKVENIEKNYDLGNTYKDLTQKKSVFEEVRKKATDDLKEPITMTVGDMNEKVTILNLSQELGLELKKPNFRTKGKFDRKLPKQIINPK